MMPTADEDKVDSFAEVLDASDTMVEFGAATTTLNKDDGAWAKWSDFCSIWGWSPIITIEEATQQPQIVARKLGTFMLWVYPQLKGRQQAQAKARSALAYPLAVMRIFNRRKVPMPKAKVLKGELDALLRMHKQVHGVVANGPQRKHPLLPAQWQAVEDLKEGQDLPGRQPWSPRTRRMDRVLLRMARVCRRTANRIRELCEGHDKEDISFMTRASASYRLSGVIYTDPSPEQVRKRKAGDIVYLVQCESKPDQGGERNCPFPCILPYDGTPTCAAAGLMDQEIEEPCRGRERRERTPLFANEQGRAYSYYVLSKELYLLLRAVLGEQAAKLLSWHSIRIGTACALHAVGCPDSVIQLLCRWACVESLHAYRRLNTKEQIQWLDKAADAKYDVLQAAHLPVLDQDVRYAATSFEMPREELEQALDAAEPPEEMPELQSPQTNVPAFVAPPPQQEGTWTAGDYTMIPASLWPTYPCMEYDGKGWLARILQVRCQGLENTARVYFERARTRSGQRFEEVWLQTSVLQRA